MQEPVIRRAVAGGVKPALNINCVPWGRVIAQQFVDTPHGFLAPPSYLAATLEERAAVCNGVGTSQLDVPDRPLGVDFREPANIHDWQTHLALSRWEKMVSDVVFLINLMLAVIAADMTESGGNPVRATFFQRVRFIARLKVATVYFLAVWRHGIARNAGIVPWWSRTLDCLAWPVAVLRAVVRMVGSR